jgi:hypothetical protein
LLKGLESWQNSGVQGLQTVVLYSLPELDGAVETIVLGGLVGDKIVIIPERTHKLCSRVKAWVKLRKLESANRKLAIMASIKCYIYTIDPGMLCFVFFPIVFYSLIRCLSALLMAFRIQFATY